MTVRGKFIKLKLAIIAWEYNTHQAFQTMFEGCTYDLHDVVQYIDWLGNDPSRVNLQYAMQVGNHMYKIVKGYKE